MVRFRSEFTKKKKKENQPVTRGHLYGGFVFIRNFKKIVERSKDAIKVQSLGNLSNSP